jgi:hypothetical protein
MSKMEIKIQIYPEHDKFRGASWATEWNIVFVPPHKKREELLVLLLSQLPTEIQYQEIDGKSQAERDRERNSVALKTVWDTVMLIHTDYNCW